MMYLYTPEVHTQIVDALNSSDYDQQMVVRDMLKAMQPVKATAWYELNADMNAWFLAYGHNSKAATKALYTPTKD